jgi:hypothetical protein
MLGNTWLLMLMSIKAKERIEEVINLTGQRASKKK